MELETTARSLASHGDLTSGMFGLSLDNEAHIISILRSTLYTNKELAVLREYSTNAWDAHVDAGIPQRPIKVVLPTVLDPTLTIRDYGRGMSEETVYGVYSQYGASTKRASNTTVGFLGIGSKSAFAYADTFSITSFHGGVKCLYVAALDETNRGRITKLVEEPCGEESGIEIRIAVNPDDIPSFVREATDLFQFFDPRPDINLVLPERDYDRRQHGFIEKPPESVTGETATHPSPGIRWVAVMGVVPYRLNFAKMSHDLKTLGLDNVVDTIGGALFFDIGEVSVSASREELEYTPRTRAAVVARLRVLFDDLLGHVMKTVDDPATSAWVKRLAVTQFFRSTRLAVPEKFEPWFEEEASIAAILDGDGNSATPEQRTPLFQMLGYHRRYPTAAFSARMQPTWEIPILPATRLLIRDTNLSLLGYHLEPESDRVVTVTEENIPDFLTCVEQAGLTGIPIIRLSTLTHDKERAKKALAEEKEARRRSQHSPKHTQRRFVLRAGYLRTSPPYSANWDILDHVPTQDDVFIILNHFVPAPIDDSRLPRGTTHFFYDTLTQDRQMFETYGITVPPIYGIKTTQKDPVSPEQVLGIPYAKWRADQIGRLLRKKGPDLDYQSHIWWCLFRRSNLLSYSNTPAYLLPLASKHLPNTHPVMQFLAHADQYVQTYEGFPEPKQRAVAHLASIRHPKWSWPEGPPEGSDAHTHVSALLARYPLLYRHADTPGLDLFRLRDDDALQPWLDYFNLIDRVTP